MKKIVPILVVLALVVAAGLGYFMTQGSNEPATASKPAESGRPSATAIDTNRTGVITKDNGIDAEIDPNTDPETGLLDQSALLKYFEQTYEYVWSAPENYNADYNDTTMEEDALSFFIEEDGYSYVADYLDAYIAWKTEHHPTNAYHLVFSGSYTCKVSVWVMPVYASPHTTLPSIGARQRFDIIESAEASSDGNWYRAKDSNGDYFYYRTGTWDLGLSGEEILSLWAQHSAEQQQTTPTPAPQQQPTPTPESQQQQQTDTGNQTEGSILDYYGGTLPDWLTTPSGEGVIEDPDYSGFIPGTAPAGDYEIKG